VAHLQGGARRQSLDGKHLSLASLMGAPPTRMDVLLQLLAAVVGSALREPCVAQYRYQGKVPLALTTYTRTYLVRHCSHPWEESETNPTRH
jgi:hypothetical protein